MKYLILLMALTASLMAQNTIFGKAGMPDEWDILVLDVDSLRVAESIIGDSAYVSVDSLQSDHITGTDMVLTGPATVDSLDAQHGVFDVGLTTAGYASADSIDGRIGVYTTLDVDSLDTNHLVVNTTAALGAAVTSDSGGTISLNTNTLNWGASTTGDQDGSFIYNEPDDMHEIRFDDGSDFWKVIGDNWFVGSSATIGIEAGLQMSGAEVISSNATDNITGDPGRGGAATWNAGNNEADTLNIQVNDFFRLESAVIMAELSTPSAITDYGRVYPKSDNQLYFQDGAGVEHLITLGASDYGEMGNIYGESATEALAIADEWYGMYHANITGAAPHLNNGFTFTAGTIGAGNITTAQAGAGINIADAAHGLVDGDIIAVQSANHVGVDTVTYVDAGNFEITIAYVGDEAGTWQEGSYLECATTGQYRGVWTASFSQSLNNTQTSIVTPFLNTTQATKATAARLLANNTDVGSVAGNGLMSFTAGDRIWFACQTTAAQTLTFTVRNVTIH